MNVWNIVIKMSMEWDKIKWYQMWVTKIEWTLYGVVEINDRYIYRNKLNDQELKSHHVPTEYSHSNCIIMIDINRYIQIFKATYDVGMIWSSYQFIQYLDMRFLQADIHTNSE